MVCLSHPDLNRFFNLAVINRKVEECPSLRMAMDVFLGAGIQEKWKEASKPDHH